MGYFLRPMAISETRLARYMIHKEMEREMTYDQKIVRLSFPFE